MRQLAELTTLLINYNWVAAENIEGFADEPKIRPSGVEVSFLTVNNEPGIILYRQTYTGTFNIDNYPFKEHPPEELFGVVSAYLLDNGNGSDEIIEPDIDIDILDDSTANIEISIQFEQDVFAVEDPAGIIIVDGVNYRLSDPVIDYVQQGDVKDDSVP